MVVSRATKACSSLVGFVGSSPLSTSRSILSAKGMAVCAIALLTLTQTSSVDAVLPGVPLTAFALNSFPVAGGLAAAINPAATLLVFGASAFLSWVGWKLYSIPPLPPGIYETLTNPEMSDEKAYNSMRMVLGKPPKSGRLVLFQEYVTVCI